MADPIPDEHPLRRPTSRTTVTNRAIELPPWPLRHADGRTPGRAATFPRRMAGTVQPRVPAPCLQGLGLRSITKASRSHVNTPSIVVLRHANICATRLRLAKLPQFRDCTELR